jgi:hypothetical protein
MPLHLGLIQAGCFDIIIRKARSLPSTFYRPAMRRLYKSPNTIRARTLVGVRVAKASSTLPLAMLLDLLDT